MKYIDAERLKAEIKGLQCEQGFEDGMEERGYQFAIKDILDIIDSLQHEIPDKETILRICKLHKAWSIMAPWENIEDFVITNWNSENIV